MFYKKVVEAMQDRGGQPGLQSLEMDQQARLEIVPRGVKRQRQAAKAWPELASISARRFSAFFAEAAVLVLVFGVLDFFMQHGHMERGWVAGALMISVGLLAASVGTEFSARRWLGAHP